jgi:hypothetical protein
MVTPRLSILMALSTLCVAACDGGAALVTRTEEPMLYVVLSPDAPAPPESALTAVVATTATPIQLEYRSAERFLMQRVSDGASFAWREVAVTQTTPDGRPLTTPIGGNYMLNERAGVGGLGRADLVPGESYALDILTLGRRVTGSVTIPERPVPSVVQRAGKRLVEWSRSRGAAMYLLQLDTDVQGTATVSDTFYVLRDDLEPAALPAKPRVRITAVDTNLWRYTGDSTVTSAGVRGGYGLVGALVSVEVELPPR